MVEQDMAVVLKVRRKGILILPKEIREKPESKRIVKSSLRSRIIQLSLSH